MGAFLDGLGDLRQMQGHGFGIAAGQDQAVKKGAHGAVTRPTMRFEAVMALSLVATSRALAWTAARLSWGVDSLEHEGDVAHLGAQHVAEGVPIPVQDAALPAGLLVEICHALY